MMVLFLESSSRGGRAQDEVLSPSNPRHDRFTKRRAGAPFTLSLEDLYRPIR
jgi:hypothetical protein